MQYTHGMRDIDIAAVVPVDIGTAKEFIERWHYSGKAPTGKNIYFGWLFHGELYAVADYGIGVNPYQASFLSRKSGFQVTNDNLVELKRLCRVEPKIDSLPLTAFLSRCHKILASDGYRFVVSFSDPEEGHNGGIYKAANFLALGQTNAENHAIDSSGTKHHRRYDYRYAKRKGITMQEARDALGLKIYRSKPKDRWLLKIA